MSAEILCDWTEDEHIEQDGKTKTEEAVSKEFPRTFPIKGRRNKVSGKKKQKPHEEGLQVHLPGGKKEQ